MAGVNNRKNIGADISFMQYIRSEITRSYFLENDEARYSERREKVYTFIRMPKEVERFMAYGFLQCADAFLFVLTFLPIRFVLALFYLTTRPVRLLFSKSMRSKDLLQPSEICDLLKGIVIIISSVLIHYVDTAMLYHMIKSQSIIKLYIFFNMLEVADRLFSAFGQDLLDTLFWTATEKRARKREHFGVIPHLAFATCYVFLHTLLVLFQSTTINVAINSSNKALLTIMISNNFVELKGSVFKKFEKNNLFQMSCSDVRERFHYTVLLLVVMIQTMKEYAWREERLWILIPDCLLVLVSEICVDWIKHAFITRFNEIPVEVYRDYTTSLAYDLANSKHKNAFTDHSDLVSRRMGFIPLPLGVLAIRILTQSLNIDGIAAVIICIIAYLCLVTLKVLNGLMSIGKACDLIAEHRKSKSDAKTPLSTNNNISTTSGESFESSPIGTSAHVLAKRSISQPSSRKPSVTDRLSHYESTCAHHFTTLQLNKSKSKSATHSRSTSLADIKAESIDSLQDGPPPLGPNALFANSTVSLNSIGFAGEEKLLQLEEGGLNSRRSLQFDNIPVNDAMMCDDVTMTEDGMKNNSDVIRNGRAAEYVAANGMAAVHDVTGDDEDKENSLRHRVVVPTDRRLSLTEVSLRRNSSTDQLLR